MKIRRFLKDWSLLLSLLAGACGYFLCRGLGLPASVREAMTESVGYIQPVLIFGMLTLTFCRVRFREMGFSGWQWRLLAFQAGVAALLCLLHGTMPDPTMRISLQSTMLCFLCPTATAAAVMTGKLGGDVGSLTTYTMLVNLMAAVLIPTFVPLVNPTGGLGFWISFWMIIRKVFPLLIGPMVAAAAIRRFFPALLRRLTSIPDLAFYLWLISASLALAVTTRILVHADISLLLCLLIVAGSLVACAMQFGVGKMVGKRYADSISAGQACGQKNTVLAIWVGSTFLDPLTSVAGGFYTIWHNTFNAWQLYRKRKPAGPTQQAGRTNASE